MDVRGAALDSVDQERVHKPHQRRIVGIDMLDVFLRILHHLEFVTLEIVENTGQFLGGVV